MRRSIRVRLVDLPGALHQLTSLVSVEDVNIVRLEVVSHEQSDVWDDIELAAETEHQLDALVASLKSHGVQVIGLPPAWAIRDWATDVLHALETIGACESEGEAVEMFASSAASIANVEHAFVLMEPARPDALAAETRWSMIEEAAMAFDPDEISWSGNSVGTRIVASAMKAARADQPSLSSLGAAVGAVVGIPLSGRRPAHLVVVGRRPLFLEPELARLGMFAQVAAPHLSASRLRASA